ncbi:MAG: ATP-binding protein [Acidimicrobiales bacterium]
MAQLLLPGLELATVGDDSWYAGARVGANEWALAIGSPTAQEKLLAAAALPGAPSAAVAAVGDEPAGLFRIELDVCGAWVTTASSGGLRPVAVRSAGWVDLRGHSAGVPADDRIGLGPGDALVVTPEPAAGEMLDSLLHVAGRPARDLATGAGRTRSIALAVPRITGEEATARVERATGVPIARLSLPGYPLGDQQPDLWHHPPAPPREARLRLGVDASEISVVRRLLRRLLSSWRLDAVVEDGDVELLATEIATNAMRHAGTGATLVVRYLGDRIRIEVGDGSSVLPRIRTPDENEPGGRGLPMIEALSSRWGVIETVDGKRVWFEVATKPHTPA